MAKPVHKIVFVSDCQKHGWCTVCGRYFWCDFRGTTEDSGVTCKRCLAASMKKGKK